MENKNHLSIKASKEKSNIRHMKYMVNDRELISNFHISISIMVSLKEKKLLKANIWRVSQFGTISLI